MRELLTLKKIGKSFGDKKVLEKIDLSINAGEFLIIIGCNGSGKSTLLKIIANVSTPTNGTRIAEGQKDNLKISYVPDRFPKLPLKPREYLFHMGKIQGLSEDYINTRIEELFNLFNFNSEMQKSWIKNCSKGTIQKVAIMQSVLAKQDLIILDEPFSGLDFEAQHQLVKTLIQLNNDGVTIIMTCHEKGFIEKFNCRMIKLEGRKIISDSTINCQSSNEIMLIRFTYSLDDLSNKLKVLNGVYSIKKDSEFYIIHTDRENCDRILKELLNIGCSIDQVQREKPKV